MGSESFQPNRQPSSGTEHSSSEHHCSSHSDQDGCPNFVDAVLPFHIHSSLVSSSRIHCNSRGVCSTPLLLLLLDLCLESDWKKKHFNFFGCAPPPPPLPHPTPPLARRHDLIQGRGSSSRSMVTHSQVQGSPSRGVRGSPSRGSSRAPGGAGVCWWGGGCDQKMKS